jgi:hypothetical protein
MCLTSCFSCNLDLVLVEHPSSPPVISRVRVTRSLVLCVMFWRSLFVFLSFFFWPFCCLSFFDLRILMTSWSLQPLLPTVKLDQHVIAFKRSITIFRCQIKSVNIQLFCVCFFSFLLFFNYYLSIGFIRKEYILKSHAHTKIFIKKMKIE